MNADNTQQASGRGWLYLTGSGDDVQQHGPFDVEAMKVLLTQNYLTEHALVWTPGQDNWQPLKACQELYEQLVFSDQEPGRPPKKKKQKKETTDADLLDFEAEIAAIEDGQAPEGSPPPEDRTFVDDDGTTFVWDSTLRKFRPEDMAPPVSQNQQEATTQPAAATPGEYTQDMMTFGGIDETVVTLDEAQAEQEEELLNAVQDEDGAPGAVQPSGQTSTPAAAQPASEPDVKAKESYDKGQEVGKSGTGEGGKEVGTAAADSKDGGASGTQEVAAGSSNKKCNNTSVYVLGIPDDATEDEVAEEFSRCGIISQHADGSPRVKLYRDRETGMMKGDALVTFLQRPSVSLALTLMHGRALRPLCGGRPMSVQEAKFEPKGDAATAAANTSSAPKPGNSSGVKKGPKGGAGKGKGKKAPSQAAQALGWGGFDDKQKATEVTVVFCNLFSPDDMTLSPDLEGVLSEYIIRRCKDLGAIERVRVFRKSPGGVATARFRVPDDAQTAIQRFSGTAVIWGMFSPAEMRERGAKRATEVEEDVVERAVSLDVRLVPQGGLGVLHGESGHGMVAVGCADIAGMQRLQLGFDAQSYDGRILKAEAVEAFLWDGETKPETYGEAATAAPSDQARLDAYAAELQAQ